LATNIVIPENIIKQLNSLPKEVRIKFWGQLEKLVADPSYPSLRNEKLEGTNQWAFRITMEYRSTYIRDKNNLIITAIGTHKAVLGN
jgi:mRNA-degrading endonuclease RelE of RelBE toxin-antitoxin system